MAYECYRNRVSRRHDYTEKLTGNYSKMLISRGNYDIIPVPKSKAESVRPLTASNHKANYQELSAMTESKVTFPPVVCQESKNRKLCRDEVMRQLHYNPDTGDFVRLLPSGKSKSGELAGSIHKQDRYRRIGINKKHYQAHRIAWLYVYGYLPENKIDHINGIRDDNRIINLREVSDSCNSQNCAIRANNNTGLPGISWDVSHKKWNARIMINFKAYFLGRYKTAIDAALARLTAEEQCPKWSCNQRSELVKAIIEFWPEFRKNKNKDEV